MKEGLLCDLEFKVRDAGGLLEGKLNKEKVITKLLWYLL